MRAFAIAAMLAAAPAVAQAPRSVAVLDCGTLVGVGSVELSTPGTTYIIPIDCRTEQET